MNNHNLQINHNGIIKSISDINTNNSNNKPYTGIDLLLQAALEIEDEEKQKTNAINDQELSNIQNNNSRKRSYNKTFDESSCSDSKNTNQPNLKKQKIHLNNQTPRVKNEPYLKNPSPNLNKGDDKKHRLSNNLSLSSFFNHSNSNESNNNQNTSTKNKIDSSGMCQGI